MTPALLDNVQSILMLGAHADDIEIGCGATVLQIARQRPDIRVHWAVFSGDGRRRTEAENSAAAFLTGFADRAVEIHAFRDGFFPDDWAAIKLEFERLKQRFDPDLVFTHYRHDLHQDHRIMSELTWNTFRDHLVLEYEIPKYDGDLGRPNVFWPIDETCCTGKTDLLQQHFPSQAGKAWFDAELFRALMRIRGMECAAPDRYAEAFYGRKMRLSVAAEKV